MFSFEIQKQKKQQQKLTSFFHAPQKTVQRSRLTKEINCNVMGMKERLW